MTETTIGASAPVEPGHNVTFLEALRVWVVIYSFGGPAGQMAVMHRIVVEEKRGVSETRFLHALNYTMLPPGPEAQQLATYVGWLLHGMWPSGCMLVAKMYSPPVFSGFFSAPLTLKTYAGTSRSLLLFRRLRPL